MGLILDKEINENELETLSPDEWLIKLTEAIREDLLTAPETEALIDDPMGFIVGYTKDIDTAAQIYDQIVRSFFFSMMETKERSKNTQKVLADFALEILDTKLNTTTGISAVDLSHIYKNLK